MQITIITVGKIKEKFYRDAVAEYTKRLGTYCRLNIVEVEDEKTPENASENEKQRILEKEAARIIPKVPDGACVITLEIEGKKLSSEGLADRINDLGINGVSHIVFIIGGSLGLHDSVKALAHKNPGAFPVSFSDMTFPHQLMRVILLEQIYRAFRIIRNEPYHK